ncbi:MAG: hypothetical protein Tsb006_0570 [Rickettsiaceae bacterium]
MRPYETNGKGTPTTGTRPITMAIFINTWQKNSVVMPIAISLANFALQFTAINKELINIIEYKVNKIMPPAKPNSSIKKENIKSV